MALYVYNSSSESNESRNARFDGIIAGIAAGDIVVVQLPTGNGHTWEQAFISHLKAYGAKVLIWLHRTEFEALTGFDSLKDFIYSCKFQEGVIVDSSDMRSLLCENGIFYDKVFVKEEANEWFNDEYYIVKILKLSCEATFLGNKCQYQSFEKDVERRNGVNEFTYFVARKSYDDKVAISFNYQGNVDVFVIKSDDEVIWHTENKKIHYAVVNQHENYVIHAMVYTQTGKLSVAKTEVFGVDVPVFDNEAPDISIVIPMYNSAKFIARTIDSVLGQSKDNIELILVDDESKDNTCKIVEWYSTKFDNVKLIKKQNGGQAEARNYGIEAAKGKYIGFMDHDDTLPVVAHENLFSAIVKENSDIAFGPFVRMTTYDNELCEKYDAPDGFIFSPYDILQMETYRMIWNRLYRAELCKEHRFGPRIFEDNAWIPVILSYSKKICYVDEIVYEYNQTIVTQGKGTWNLPPEEIEKMYKTASFYALANCNSLLLESVKQHEVRFWNSLKHIFPNCDAVINEINCYTK